MDTLDSEVTFEDVDYHDLYHETAAALRKLEHLVLRTPKDQLDAMGFSKFAANHGLEQKYLDMLKPDEEIAKKHSFSNTSIIKFDKMTTICLKIKKEVMPLDEARRKFFPEYSLSAFLMILYQLYQQEIEANHACTAGLGKIVPVFVKKFLHENKVCLHCGKLILSQRADTRFCDGKCRSSYHKSKSQN